MVSTRRGISSFIFLTFFIGVVCSTHVTASNPNKNSLSNQVTANIPTMIPGDRWVYITSSETFGAATFQLKVIEVKPDGAYTAEYYGEKEKHVYHVHYDVRGRLIKKTDTVTGEDMRINTPPPTYTDFPLFVGKSWHNDYEGACIDGSFNAYEDRCTVEKIETITTEAGMFEAFRIDRSIRNKTQHGQGSETIWYVPEVKRIVKVEASWKGISELVSYKMATIEMDAPIIELTSSELESGFALVKDKSHIEIKGSVRDESDIKSFTIKDTDVPVDESGEFSYTASLTEGENYIAFKAQDVHGNQAEKAVVVKSEVSEVAPTYYAPKKALARKLHITRARWALVIGISNYQDTRIPTLRYAASDALSFYNWLIAPSGGQYSPARVKVLLDDEATEKNIKTMLFKWLKQAIEEDVLTIYFAGHGSPDSPDSPQNLFLLTYDTQYENIAATGFPMWDIETALKRFIPARKVIILADACHSGGLGKSFEVARRTYKGIKMNPISSGLQELSKVSDGVCVITASTDKELSQESKKWGGGHGVFTYYLLKGLKGEADYNRDGKATLGELIPYISEQVRRATRNAQSPIVAGKFDPVLSIGK